MTSSLQESFLRIIRLGIGHYAEALCCPVDWNEMQALAERQGLAAVLVDGIEKIPDNLRPPKEDLLQMIGQVVQSYEYRYEQYRRAIAELAGFYRVHGLKMMVLKGYACSLDWPKPEHRPCGDIDIWQFGEQKEGDYLLEREKDIKVDKSHHHHTVFNWRGFTVENHYDFINTYRYSSNKRIESLLKNLGRDDKYYVELYEERVCIPSPNLNAMFLLRHSMMDFVASSMSMRQILDWAFFIEKHTNDIDWEWLIGVLDDCHMREFFNLINAICVDNLGFNSQIFPSVQFVPNLKERVLDDILQPKFEKEEPNASILRIFYKYKRWQGNAWKQRLCFRESRLENFISGILAHIQQPSEI